MKLWFRHWYRIQSRNIIHNFQLRKYSIVFISVLIDMTSKYSGGFVSQEFEFDQKLIIHSYLRRLRTLTFVKNSNENLFIHVKSRTLDKVNNKKNRN